MALDYEAIGAAIAARFATAATPSGEDALALATDDLPDQIGATPALLVFPPEEDLDWGPGLTRHSVQRWPVRFFRTQGSSWSVRVTGISRWRKALLDTVVGNIGLGLAYVDWAQVSSVKFVEATYAEIVYDALEFIVTVKTREQVAASA